MPDQQLTLDPGHLKPSTPGNPLYCHEDFLSEMEANRATPVGKRASLLLQRLLLNERREFFKSTQGLNKGWRRSRLGGSNGSHFYAWLAPRGSAPLAEGGFESAPEGAIFLRAIRHHDDHTPLEAHNLTQNYIALDATEIRDDSLVPAPWTHPQTKFARARQNVRTLRGFPGSGKTTALWHAAETAATGAVLYITYSRDLAALAQDYFAKLVPAHKRCHVVTFPELVRICSMASEIAEPFRASRERFLKEISTVSPRLLGPWAEAKSALYDEMHAHLIGAALPEAIGRWPASPLRRMSPKDYRALREKAVGRQAVEAVLEVADALDKRGDKPIEDRFFPELKLARRGVERPRASSLWLQQINLNGFDCIAIDEAQDLTPIEALLLIEIALASRQKTTSRITFLAAGDEAQTVRATDFTWAWFHDLLHHKLGSPTDFELRANLRSPQRIAEIINRVWTLYGHIAKEERPGGAQRAELEDESGDQVVFCAGRPGDELSDLLNALAVREGLAIVNLTDSTPAWVPEAVRPYIVTPSDIKGLDFHSVCILNGGQFAQRITSNAARASRIDDLSKRLAIDQLRVAVSRPTERLYWLEVDPAPNAIKESQQLLGGAEWDLTLPVVPAVVLTALEQEALPVEERIRLCEGDARQFLAVKPDIAWSRANQAVALLGHRNTTTAVLDPALRRSAHLTLAEIAFCLALRGVKLSPQLGNPDLYGESLRHSEIAGGKALALVFDSAEGLQKPPGSDELMPYLTAASGVLVGMEELAGKEGTGWLRLELEPHSARWISQIEKYLDRHILAYDAARLLPGFYKLFEVVDADAKTRQARLRAASTLLEGKHPGPALELLNLVPDCDPRLKARCIEATGNLGAAAEAFLAAGFAEEALRCYRTIPEFDKALKVAKKLGDHPARESLEWLGKMKALADARPADFKKVMLPSETKYLEGVLETALGVSRKKPVKKAAATVTKKKAVSRTPVKRK